VAFARADKPPRLGSLARFPAKTAEAAASDALNFIE